MNSSTTPTSVPIFKSILKWSVVVAIAVAVIGGGIGFLAVGVNGLWSALFAAAITLLFTGITVVSVILASHLDQIFFMATILGAWILKFIVFLGALFLIRDLPIVHLFTLWLCLVVAVIATVIVDVVCVVRGRMGNVSDVRLPGDDK
ncbi:MAG: hypothetical protein ACTIA6_03770 [Pseudoclavibacter sp.]